MTKSKKNQKQDRIPSLIKKYADNNCSPEEAQEVLNLLENPENDLLLRSKTESLFEKGDFMRETQNTTELKQTMDRILDRLHHRIRLREEKSGGYMRTGFLRIFSRVAAILLLPLLAYSVYISFENGKSDVLALNHPNMQTVKTATGMQTDFQLPDGSHVWLNSGSILKYPVPFANDIRQVELTGEAYFDVRKDASHPFVVNAGTMNIEVKGTKFNVVNYPDEATTEMILESGSVQLFSGDYENRKTIIKVKPGEMASYDKSANELKISKVEVDKYMAWKNGTLIFRDDKMDEVVRKLNRWFNVEIILQSPQLKEYIYTATYREETLAQILELLKISAPIKYTITDRVRQPDNSFSKRKIYITKQN